MVLALVIGDLHIPHRAIDIPPKFKLLLTPGKIQQVLCTGNLNYASNGYEFLKLIASDVRIVRSPMDEIANNVSISADSSQFASAGSNDIAEPPLPVAFGKPPQSRPVSTTSAANWPSGIGGVRGLANPLTWPASVVVTHGAVRIGLCSSYARLPGSNLCKSADNRDILGSLAVKFNSSKRADGASDFATQAASVALHESLEQLSIIARKLNVDVLITGGFGQQFAAVEWGGRLYVNPGSATGAFDFTDSTVIQSLEEAAVAREIHRVQGIKDEFVPEMKQNTPSFVLMDIHDAQVVLYIYKLIDGQVKVEKLDFTRKIYH